MLNVFAAIAAEVANFLSVQINDVASASSRGVLIAATAEYAKLK
jgi:hypothetical protein